MKHKTLGIILVVLLGGMALYYNKSASENVTAKPDNATKVENVK